MKTRTKITVTLAVGIGLLVGSMGVASASPHYSDWNGKTGFSALDNSISLGFSHNLEWDLKAPVSSYIKLGDIKGAVEAPVSSYIKLGDIKGAVEAPVSSYIKLGDIKGAGRLSGFTHHANIDRLHQEVVSFESGPVRPLA